MQLTFMQLQFDFHACDDYKLHAMTTANYKLTLQADSLQG